MRKSWLLCLLGLLAVSAVHAQPWSEGELSRIHPAGWLRSMLERQRDGLTGHPEAMSYPYNTCLWAGEIPRQGEHGKDWWRYEQTAYYTDGLLRLGYALGDAALIEKGTSGVRYTLAHPRPSGRLGNEKIESQWPIAVFFRAIQAAYEASPDPSVPEALTRHYLTLTPEELTDWRNIVNLEGMLWTYRLTGDRRLLEKADSAYRYKAIHGEYKVKRPFELRPEVIWDDARFHMHGVTCAEMLKLPLLLFEATRDHYFLDLALTAAERLEAEDMLPDGVYSSAEWLKGRDILHSHETCDIVDYTWTLGHFLRVTGDARWADRLERAVFNAGLGAITKDFKAIQYFSSVNQFIATGTSNHNEFFHGKTWMAYRPVHETECCIGNIHRLLPDYVARMWLRGKDGEIVAALYGPSDYAFEGGVIHEETAYPFSEEIAFRFALTKRSKAAFRFRIPCWCTAAEVLVNGEKQVLDATPGTFVTLDRIWRDGDVVALRLPMPLEVKTVQESNGARGTYVEAGPLLYSFPIRERWEEDRTDYPSMRGKHSENPSFRSWNITPNGPWNFALAGTPAYGTLADRGLDQPFRTVTVPARRIDWALEEGRYTPDLPVSPKPVTEKPETLTLIPYGLTQLRLTVFPELR